MGNPKNDKDSIDAIVKEMFTEGGLDISQKLCLQDFTKVLGGHLSSATSISLGWKGFFEFCFLEMMLFRTYSLENAS